ncbi:MAG TPA: chemotaxis protein CheW [Polyangiaceae bacterium]|nr:chemotaxis protein CheW [Polyangiaceae bacterium]
MSSSDTLERKLTAGQLRAEFDRSFAAVPRGAADGLEDLLLIRVCGDGYALRTSHLTGVLAVKKLTPLPSNAPALLGLVAVRGVLVPVFGLSLLLGYESSTEPVRWLAVVGTEEPVAFAFHALTDFRKLPASAFSTAEASADFGGHERVTVNFDGQVRVVIGVPALVRSIRERVGRARPKKEA